MTIETDEGFVSLIAETDAEALLLAPIAEAINSKTGPTGPAQLTDNIVNGLDHRIINGVLTLSVN